MSFAHLSRARFPRRVSAAATNPARGFGFWGWSSSHGSAASWTREHQLQPREYKITSGARTRYGAWTWELEVKDDMVIEKRDGLVVDERPVHKDELSQLPELDNEIDWRKPPKLDRPLSSFSQCRGKPEQPQQPTDVAASNARLAGREVVDEIKTHGGAVKGVFVPPEKGQKAEEWRWKPRDTLSHKPQERREAIDYLLGEKPQAPEPATSKDAGAADTFWSDRTVQGDEPQWPDLTKAQRAQIKNNYKEIKRELKNAKKEGKRIRREVEEILEQQEALQAGFGEAPASAQEHSASYAQPNGEPSQAKETKTDKVSPLEAFMDVFAAVKEAKRVTMETAKQEFRAAVDGTKTLIEKNTKAINEIPEKNQGERAETSSTENLQAELETQKQQLKSAIDEKNASMKASMEDLNSLRPPNAEAAPEKREPPTVEDVINLGPPIESVNSQASSLPHDPPKSSFPSNPPTEKRMDGGMDGEWGTPTYYKATVQPAKGPDRLQKSLEAENARRLNMLNETESKLAARRMEELQSLKTVSEVRAKAREPSIVPQESAFEAPSPPVKPASESEITAQKPNEHVPNNATATVSPEPAAEPKYFFSPALNSIVKPYEVQYLRGRGLQVRKLSLEELDSWGITPKSSDTPVPEPTKSSPPAQGSVAEKPSPSYQESTPTQAKEDTQFATAPSPEELPEYTYGEPLVHKELASEAAMEEPDAVEEELQASIITNPSDGLPETDIPYEPVDTKEPPAVIYAEMPTSEPASVNENELKSATKDETSKGEKQVDDVLESSRVPFNDGPEPMESVVDREPTSEPEPETSNENLASSDRDQEFERIQLMERLEQLATRLEKENDELPSGAIWDAVIEKMTGKGLPEEPIRLDHETFLTQYRISQLCSCNHEYIPISAGLLYELLAVSEEATGSNDIGVMRAVRPVIDSIMWRYEEAKLDAEAAAKEAFEKGSGEETAVFEPDEVQLDSSNPVEFPKPLANRRIDAEEGALPSDAGKTQQETHLDDSKPAPLSKKQSEAEEAIDYEWNVENVSTEDLPTTLSGSTGTIYAAPPPSSPADGQAEASTGAPPPASDPSAEEYITLRLNPATGKMEAGIRTSTVLEAMQPKPTQHQIDFFLDLDAPARFITFMTALRDEGLLIVAGARNMLVWKAPSAAAARHATDKINDILYVQGDLEQLLDTMEAEKTLDPAVASSSPYPPEPRDFSKRASSPAEGIARRSWDEKMLKLREEQDHHHHHHHQQQRTLGEQKEEELTWEEAWARGKPTTEHEQLAEKRVEELEELEDGRIVERRRPNHNQQQPWEQGQEQTLHQEELSTAENWRVTMEELDDREQMLAREGGELAEEKLAQEKKIAKEEADAQVANPLFVPSTPTLTEKAAKTIEPSTTTQEPAQTGESQNTTTSTKADASAPASIPRFEYRTAASSAISAPPPSSPPPPPPPPPSSSSPPDNNSGSSAAGEEEKAGGARPRRKIGLLRRMFWTGVWMGGLMAIISSVDLDKVGHAHEARRRHMRQRQRQREEEEEEEEDVHEDEDRYGDEDEDEDRHGDRDYIHVVKDQVQKEEKEFQAWRWKHFSK